MGGVCDPLSCQFQSLLRSPLMQLDHHLGFQPSDNPAKSVREITRAPSFNGPRTDNKHARTTQTYRSTRCALHTCAIATIAIADSPFLRRVPTQRSTIMQMVMSVLTRLRHRASPCYAKEGHTVVNGNSVTAMREDEQSMANTNEA